MKIIKSMACFMMDEIEGAKDYAIMALDYQYSKPQLADMFFKMAQTEMNHFNALHEQTVGLIKEQQEKGREVPQKMLNKWDEEHKKMIECQQEVQMYMSLYK